MRAQNDINHDVNCHVFFLMHEYILCSEDEVCQHWQQGKKEKVDWNREPEIRNQLHAGIFIFSYK